ncbi:hypothetical protein OIDMADRAFT_105875 [Oidiodendron maius Zn]|uniref:NACHT domain-containing protein n=1 Tax=Oidiodendron maius (strain Zn) TaxID=913774 RepID=A0A0C3H0W8_OIDMZ|nr:hypothetical protein OIDMADRAFT_105875 [Oidiodendron maius Zn]
MVESNRDLAERIRSLERDGLIISKARSEIISGDDVSTVRGTRESMLQLGDMPAKRFTFEDDLESSRVYNRAIYRYSQLSITSTALYSTALSIFSKLSLSQVSSISFYALPVYAFDLSNSNLYVFGEEGAAQNNNASGGTEKNNNSMDNQNNSPGQQFIGTNHIGMPSNKSVTVDDIDRSCLFSLRCPDTLVVKNRLKENKGKLLHTAIEWILQDPQYISWKDGDDVCLLWVKGGAGKGKTMISIGLIDQLSLLHDASTVVTYFFCQNADYELNTLEAIIKGLILQLVNQRKELKESLRCRWDTVNERFREDITSWRTLWDILLEMLEHCKCQRVYVIIDALDECQDDGMADLLKRLVRTGLHHPSKIKWLLTSRPLDSAERELLAGSDQVLVSLELNSKHISEAIKTYIAFKMDELDRHCNYGETLRQKIQTELTEKAEDTYLWVSLVCKRLENVHRDEALTVIQDLPPGLHPLYNWVLNRLSEGELAVVKGCIRLLKVMMLAYRPLNIEEVGSVIGLSDEWVSFKALVNRCASFIQMRHTDIGFVHQSARDYLAGKNGQSILDSYENYGHGEIALSCLSYLSQRLKVNLVDLPRPDSTRELMKNNELVASMEYAATFWVQHLDSAKRTTLVQNALAEQGEVGTFLCTKLLMWLECLSLLEKLPRAVEALKILADVADDAIRFLLRHYLILVTWPLQIYSSAIVFSPQTSIVRRNNVDKLPAWLRKVPQIEDSWTSLIWTLTDPGWVFAIAFSPDGRQIASGSDGWTIKLWDATTGDLQKTLTGHSNSVFAIAFSPDGRQIASGSHDRTIKLWDATTGNFQKTLTGHLGSVLAIVFSPDSRQIASGSRDPMIKLWDATTGNLQKTLTSHSDSVWAIVFSPDSRQIASGSRDQTVKLWDATTGDLQKTLTGHLGSVLAIAFSPDSRQIASGSDDQTIRLWDATTGNLQKTLTGHSDSVFAIAFSPDGRQIASGSGDRTIKLWDAITGNLRKTLTGHSEWVFAIAFSPDGRQIASGSRDRTVKLWDTTIVDLQKTPTSHSKWVTAIAFSTDGRQIASGSNDQTIKLWDAITGNLQKTLTGPLEWVRAIAFSPDGRQIASGSNDQTIRLWDATTGDLQKTLTGHLGSVLAIAFSPDGRQIASGSDDQMIKLWDIAKVLKVSRLLGSRVGSLELRALQTIKTSHRVTSLKFSIDGRYLVTNLGLIKIKRTIHMQSPESKLKDLGVRDHWIYYGEVPVLRLPSDFEQRCHDVRGDQVTVGFSNGRVLNFDINRLSLNSIFKDSA